jgi:hypothetical protein
VILKTKNIIGIDENPIIKILKIFSKFIFFRKYSILKRMKKNKTITVMCIE